ncbi:hypothetical protein P9869_12205 [Streptomyces ossamyceticus]|nr:hypothetical protein [Streptomyces ossamyceticus]
MFTLIQNFASVYNSTPNAVIRSAVKQYLANQVNTQEFREASQVHVERARLAVDSLSEHASSVAQAGGGTEHGPLPYSAPGHTLESGDTFNQRTAIG